MTKLHDHAEDALPDAHPLAFEDVFCKRCGEMLHAGNNECMQAWVETDGGNYCVECWGQGEQKQTLVTVGPMGHGLQEGDIVTAAGDCTRWQRIKRLLVRPRVQVIGSATDTTFSLVERRMTWREWRKSMLAAIFG